MNITAVGAGLLSARWAVQIVGTLTVAIMLLGHRLPHRDDSLTRGVIGICVLAAACVAPVACGVVRGLDVGQSFVVFCVLMGAYVALLMFVYDTGPWQALFCATAGYTLQNLASGLEVTATILISHRASGTLAEPEATIVAALVFSAVYVVGYLALVRQIDRNGLTIVEDRSMLAMFLIVAFAIIGFDLLIKSLVWESVKFTTLVLIRFVHALICAFVLFAEYEILYARRMSEEKAETERLLAERDRQYRLSRENIEAINIKCHDIRHQIRHLADNGEVVDKSVLADIAHEVNVYDSVVQTGNEALDTILTEKSLACSNEGIVLSCIADGSALDFMTPSDIYSLFGNALDNAIEATRKVGDPERRTITLNVERRGAMVAVSVENYCTETPRFKDGLPLTTKRDRMNHGFGTKSMECIVRRNGGSLHMGARGGVFYLNALLAAQ